MKKSIHIGLPILLFILSSCSNNDKPLRGREEKTTDGLTYLVIEEGDRCDTILIDGIPWKHKIGEAGQIQAGIHTIDCWGEIGFEIKEGTIFYFDYWGP